MTEKDISASSIDVSLLIVKFCYVGYKLAKI